MSRLIGGKVKRRHKSLILFKKDAFEATKPSFQTVLEPAGSFLIFHKITNKINGVKK